MIKLKKPNYFLQEAIKIALKSTMRHRHGCVIVWGDKEIVSVGYNYVIINSDGKFISVHAEVSAIKKLKAKNKDYLDKCALYVVRIGPDSQHNPLKVSIPCYHCTEYIHNSGIPRVYFSVKNDIVGMVYIPRQVKPTIQHFTQNYDEIPGEYLDQCSRKYLI